MRLRRLGSAHGPRPSLRRISCRGPRVHGRRLPGGARECSGPGPDVRLGVPAPQHNGFRLDCPAGGRRSAPWQASRLGARRRKAESVPLTARPVCEATASVEASDSRRPGSLKYARFWSNSEPPGPSPGGSLARRSSRARARPSRARGHCDEEVKDASTC